MPWRGVAPIQLVIVLVGTVALIATLSMAVLSVIAALDGDDVRNSIPASLSNVCLASLGMLGGLLTPNTGLTTSGRTARHAAVAGQAAAAAVVEHEQLHDLAVEAHDLQEREGRNGK